MDPSEAARFLGCMALITTIPLLLLVVLRTRRRRRKLLEDRQATARANGRAARQADGTIKEMVDRLSGLATGIDARLEARVAELRDLLERIDERIAEIKRLSRYTPGPNRQGPVEPLAGQIVEEPLPPSARLIDDGEAGSPRQAERQPAEHSGAEILRLSRQGLDTPEIARRMDMSASDVDLVLKMLGPRKKRTGR